MSFNKDTQDRIQQFAGRQATNDYINDLISNNMIQQTQSESGRITENPMHGRISHRTAGASDACSKNTKPVNHEMVGRIYAGFIITGMASGALMGYVTSGGRKYFLAGGWIDTVFDASAGLLIGTGLGLLCDALLRLSVRK